MDTLSLVLHIEPKQMVKAQSICAKRMINNFLYLNTLLSNTLFGSKSRITEWIVNKLLEV